MLRMRHIYMSYGNNLILENLSLDIERGSIFGLIGPNGAGKTTLVNLVLNNPNFEGEIFIDEIPNYEYLKKHRNQVVYVPENTYVYDYLTGIEFLHFILEMQRIPLSNVEEKVELLFSLFGLDGYKNKIIRDFSYGMKRTVVLISALVQTPKLLILDEPVAGIDVKSIIVIKKLLRSLSKAGTTIIITTHILDLVENLSDSIAILYQKKIVFHDRVVNIGKNEIENLYLGIIGDKIDTSIKKYENLLR